MATSALNPNAPMFVPLAYRAVEDFSDQWWDLVRSSPWFRDYWLQECFSDPDTFSPTLDAAGDDVADDFLINDDQTKGKMDLVSLGWLKWRKPRGEVATPRYCEKAPKIVSVRINPRPIHQPR